MTTWVALLRGINVGRGNGKREIYVHYPNGFGASKLNDAAWKGLGVTATARTWNTVTKLLALADAESG